MLVSFQRFLAAASSETWALFRKLLAEECKAEGLCGFESGFAYLRESERVYRLGYLTEREGLRKPLCKTLTSNACLCPLAPTFAAWSCKSMYKI